MYIDELEYEENEMTVRLEEDIKNWAYRKKMLRKFDNILQ